MDSEKILFVLLVLFNSQVLMHTESDDDTTNGGDKCPDICYCDANNEIVNCVGDGLWKIPQVLPKTAVRMELRNFLMDTLSASDFSDLKLLRELKLQQMQISDIESGAFKSLENLIRLEISQNLLFNLTEDIFIGLKKLRYLDISSNKLIKIEGAFQNLSEVEQLNLRANNLFRLTENTFSGLYKVRYLNIDSNKISLINIDTFRLLRNLAHLIMSNNPIITISGLQFISNRIQYIDLSRTSLDNVPKNFYFVRDLRLAKNNIEIIKKDEFVGYTLLGLLVLDDNKIREIENNSFARQKQLMRLWLNGNKLKNVPSNLPSSLRSLYIEENLLTALPSYSFKGLMELRELFLQRNKIENISKCAFCDLYNLQKLDLQTNAIAVLSTGAFDDLKSLEILDISQNNLKIIESKCFLPLKKLSTLNLARIKSQPILESGVFYSLKNLTKLDLYNSPELSKTIINSTDILSSLKYIQEINLKNNNLENLREDFPYFFPNLNLIKLHDNKWICDQNILWLTQWIKSDLKKNKSISLVENYNTLLCYSPINMKNKPIISLEEKNFITEKLLSTQEITTSFNMLLNETRKLILTTKSHIFMTTFTTLQSKDVQDKTYQIVHEEAITEFGKKNDNLLTDVNKIEISTNMPSSAGLMHETSEKYNTNGVVIACTILACLLIIALIATIVYRRKNKDSISYLAQNDESDDASDINTTEGIGNKLYYVVENPNVISDSSNIYSNVSLHDITESSSTNNQQYLKTHYVNSIFP